MDEERLEKEKSRIHENAEKMLGKQYPGEWFSTYAVLDKTDDKHEKNLEMFKYLFSLGGDAHVFLWNHLICKIPRMDTSDISSDGYSPKEWEFIDSIIHTHMNNESRLGPF